MKILRSTIHRDLPGYIDVQVCTLRNNWALNVKMTKIAKIRNKIINKWFAGSPQFEVDASRPSNILVKHSQAWSG